jgi:hypothetical protein
VVFQVKLMGSPAMKRRLGGADVIHWSTAQQDIRNELQTYFAARRDFNLASLVGDMVAKVRYYPASHAADITILLSRESLLRHDDRIDPCLTGMCVQVELLDAFGELLPSHYHLRDLDVVIVTEEDIPPKTTAGLNNCFFRTESTIDHDDLRFRSGAEVAIYDELCKRSLLFFPNAAAVLCRGLGRKEKREPDFLICHKGKWGILEVMGDAYHKNAAKDHERARLFKLAGVLCVEFFSADDCINSPSWVVDKFLSILSQH